MADNHDDENQKDGLSRRRFIKNTGMVAGGVVGGSLLGGVLTNQFQTKPETQTKSEKTNTGLQDARMLLSKQKDFEGLETETELALPEDHIDPGAIDLGVPYFIDKHLAGQ